MGTEADSEDTRDMEALRAGEELALNLLMERHRQKLFHYLIRLLQDESEALDLAQETFVRVYLNRQKFNTKQRFTSWMYAIATNLARDRLRWFSRHRNVSMDASRNDSDGTLGEMLVEDRQAPGEFLLEQERAAQVRSALAALPEELRTPLVLVEYEDRSQAEIAGILHCTPKAVENRLYRARKFLREKLKNLMEIP